MSTKHTRTAHALLVDPHVWATVTPAVCSQIQHAEMSIMRASFILTHRPGRKFNFMDYILASLDDDCAKVGQAACPHCSCGHF